MIVVGKSNLGQLRQRVMERARSDWDCQGVCYGVPTLGGLREELLAQEGWSCSGACVRGPSHGTVAPYAGLREDLLARTREDKRASVLEAYETLVNAPDDRANEVIRFQELAKDLALYTGIVDGIWGPKTESAWTHIIPESTGRRCHLADVDKLSAWSGGTLSMAQCIAIGITRDDWLAWQGVPEERVLSTAPQLAPRQLSPALLPTASSAPTPEVDAAEGAPTPPADDEAEEGSEPDDDSGWGIQDVGTEGEETAVVTGGAAAPSAPESSSSWPAYTALAVGLALAGTGLVLWMRQRRRVAAPATAGLGAFTTALSPHRRVRFRWQQDWPHRYVTATVDPNANLVSFREQRRRLSYDYPASRMFGVAYHHAIAVRAAEQKQQRRLRRKGLVA